MNITEILRSVQFVVDCEGRPTAVLLDIDAWNALVSMLEDVEDIELIRDRMANWRSKEGWTRFEDFEAKLETDMLSTPD